MRNFVILLALGLISADKLDRTYLPPPGSKFAGGSPGAIQVPLELPKELYLGRDDGILRSPLGDPQLELGINRGLSELQATTEEAEPPFTYFQSSYRVPTTTTSYAFTQTTTLPSVLGSSIGPFNFGTTPGINIQAAAGPYRDEQFYNNNLPGFDNYGPEKPAFIIGSVPQRNEIQTQIANNVLTQSQTPEGLIENENYQGPIGNFQGQSFIPFNQQPQTFDQQIVSQYDERYPGPKTGEQRLNPTIVTPQVTTPSAQIQNELAGTHREMAPSYPRQDLSNTFPNRPALVKNISVLDSLSSAPQKSTNTNGQVLDSSQNTYQSTTTHAPITTSTSNYSEIPTSTSRFSSTIVPDISQSTLTPIRYKPRPERPQAESDRNAVILNYENSLTPEGYSYSFDTSNGIHADETGIAVDGVKAHGSYSYVGDDGKVYSVVYTADENGFQPKGDHLPTPHPVPEAIQKVIEQAAIDEAAGIYDDGSYDEAKYGYKKYQHPKIGLQTHKLQSVILNGADIPDDMQAVSRGTSEPQNTRGRPTNEGRLSKTNQVKNNEEIDNDRVPASIGKTYSTEKGPLTQMENIRNPQNIVIPGGFRNKHFQAKQNNRIKNQPTIYQRRGDQKLFTTSFPAIEEETGYQYNPPENKFRPEVNQFPTRFTETVSDENETSSMKSTIKPFITPNIYNEDEEEENAYQPDNNSNKYDDSHPEYYKKSTVSDLATGDDEGSIITSKPGSTVVAIHREYGPESTGYDNGPQPSQKETLRPGSDTSAQDNFVSTTPLSFSTTTTIQPDTTYQTYQPMRSNYDSDTLTSHRNGQPGITTSNISVFSQNPEFVPGLTVDAFGRSITEQALDEQHSTGYPFKMLVKSASFITFSDDNGNKAPVLHQEIFNPTVARFGKPTSDEDPSSITFPDAYESTENVIGEDFKGPKQPQRFDPTTGYHY